MKGRAPRSAGASAGAANSSASPTPPAAGPLRAEAGVADDSDLLHILLNSIPDRVYFKDERSRFLRISRAMGEFFKLDKPEEAIGRSDFDFFTDEHANQAYADEQRILQTGQPLIGLVEKETLPGGGFRWVTTTKMPVRDRQGKVIGTFGISRDITELKLAEEELRRAKDELERRVEERTAQWREANSALEREVRERKHAAEELRKKAEELQRSNKELEHFAYIASHDLQEPLRMVASYLQLIARRYKGRLDKNADDFIGFAVDGASRMKELINDLLEYSRVGTRGRPFETVDCKQVVQRVLRNVQFTVERTGAEVIVRELPTVVADGGQLLQLFQNLIVNGVKFHGPDKPIIQIGARDCGEEWEFFVQDNGIGIPPESFERIFQLFQRLHAREEYEGVGIGLAVCRRVVERHGGRIWVESEPGRGAKFYFTLPKRDATQGPCSDGQ